MAVRDNTKSQIPHIQMQQNPKSKIEKIRTMSSLRIYSFNPNAWYLGIVKFFDARKNIGYIASNNQGMSMGKYEQDFWICDESFVDKTAAVQDQVVVFQIEYQKDGRKRATNVRAFSNVSDEDNKLASNYLVYHEMVELKDYKVNMLNRCEVPRNYLLAKLKDIIEMQETRSVESTVKILSDFIGKYNTTCPTTNRRYIFLRILTRNSKSIGLNYSHC